ncbi:hypothetical protein IVB18_41835 [Bradyrhizobium sp. 186]|nr:hypothetical protein IVB18_41835 [Bradyrhizobium sp. 186]
MSIAIRGGANSSRDYVDTYAVESQRAAKPRIGVRLNFRRQRRRHHRMQKALSASADLATPERMSRTYVRVLRRGEVAITRFCSSRAATSRCRCDINLAKPWAMAINGPLACTQMVIERGPPLPLYKMA